MKIEKVWNAHEEHKNSGGRLLEHILLLLGSCIDQINFKDEINDLNEWH